MKKLSVKKLSKIVLLFIFLSNCGIASAQGSLTELKSIPARPAVAALPATPTTLKPATPAQPARPIALPTNGQSGIYAQPQVGFENCNKFFKVNNEKLFYLTLSSIAANRFNIDEIQSRSNYVLFSAWNRQFLANVIFVDANNSMLKITPCDENYSFPIGIVQNCFKYIELNSNTPVEKLNVS